MASLTPAIATLTPAEHEKEVVADVELVKAFVNHTYLEHVPDKVDNFTVVEDIVFDAKSVIAKIIKDAGALEESGTISHQEVASFKLNANSVFRKRFEEMDLEKRWEWADFWSLCASVVTAVVEDIVDTVVNSVLDSACAGHVTPPAPA